MLKINYLFLLLLSFIRDEEKLHASEHQQNWRWFNSKRKGTRTSNHTSRECALSLGVEQLAIPRNPDTRMLQATNLRRRGVPCKASCYLTKKSTSRYQTAIYLKVIAEVKVSRTFSLKKQVQN